MRSGHAEAGIRPEAGRHWVTAGASLAVGVAFLSLWFWLLPPWLGFHFEAPDASWWRWLAAVPAALGFGVALRCVWSFGWTGGGTPAPVAPPRRLVVVGLYRHVRNPMYLGFFVGWAGLWALFGRANAAAILVASVMVLSTVCFVLLYEEPTLRRVFGAEYEEYCKHVPRWAPRLRAWRR